MPGYEFCPASYPRSDDLICNPFVIPRTNGQAMAIRAEIEIKTGKLPKTANPIRSPPAVALGSHRSPGQAGGVYYGRLLRKEYQLSRSGSVSSKEELQGCKRVCVLTVWVSSEGRADRFEAAEQLPIST